MIRGSDDEAVSPIVATLVLILVAVIGAISVAYLVGALSTDTAKRVIDPFAHQATPTPGPQILIVDSPQTYSLDQQLARQYMATHSGVRVTIQSSPDEYASAMSLSQNISDIVALSRAPSSSLRFKDPKMQAHFIAGRAVVVIANSNMNISALSRSDLSMVYSQTPQSVPADLLGLSVVVRNYDDEDLFAGWLTNGVETSLDNYMMTPIGVMNYTAHNDSEVIAMVSNTSGAIGFVYWQNIANNVPTESNIQIIPIVNENNGMVQTPSNTAIKEEMATMSNTYYDDGMIGGLYYLTEGQPNSITQGYIDWCRSQDAASQITSMGLSGPQT